jgi:hypothetical protein
MRFSSVVTLLRDTGHRAYVLQSRRKGKRGLVAPSLVGRIMGTTATGDRGEILGWVNVPAIEKGMVDPVFNNFGGEERFWFAPEGGQFGLNLGGHLSGWQYYEVQDALNTQPFRVLKKEANALTMFSRMKLINARSARFDMEVTRTVRILDECPYVLGYDGKVDFVGFETINISRNAAAVPVRRTSGALAMFCLTQFLAHPRLVIIVPFHPGSSRLLGSPVRKDYWKDFCTHGVLPRHRYHVDKSFALMKGDGSLRGKFGIGRRRAVPRLASLDLDTDEMVIVDCDFYPELEYVGSYWRYMQDPYDGDALSVSFEGPNEKGQPGRSYELETLSPALFLEPGQAFSHRNRIYHLFGPAGAINQICRKFLGVDRTLIEHFDACS